MSVDAAVIDRPLNSDPYGVRANMAATGEKDTYALIAAGLKHWQQENPGKKPDTAILNKISLDVSRSQSGQGPLEPINGQFNQATKITPKLEPEVIAAQRRPDLRDVPTAITAADVGPIQIDRAELDREFAELAANLPELTVPEEEPAQVASAEAEGEEIVVTGRPRGRGRDRAEPALATKNEERRDVPTAITAADVGPIQIDLDRELAELAANLPELTVPDDDGATSLARNEDVTPEESARLAAAPVSRAPQDTNPNRIGGSLADMRTQIRGPEEQYLFDHFIGRATSPYTSPTARVLTTANAIQVVARNKEEVTNLTTAVSIESSGGFVGDRPGSNYQSPFQIGRDEVAAQFRKRDVIAKAAEYGITPQFALRHRDHPLVGALAANGMLNDINSGLRANFGAPGGKFSAATHNGLMYASYNQGPNAGIKLGQAALAVREGRMDPHTPAWQAMGIPEHHATGNKIYFFNRDGTTKTVTETLNAFTIAAGASQGVVHARLPEHFPGNRVDVGQALEGIQTPQAQAVAASYTVPSTGSPSRRRP